MKNNNQNCIKIIDSVVRKIELNEDINDIKAYLLNVKSKIAKKESEKNASNYIEDLIDDLK